MIRRTAGLLVVLAVVGVVQYAASGAGPEGGSTALAAGFALIAAVLVGALVEGVGLPRVTGYLVVGLLAGPSLASLITEQMARELRLLNGLAVALIAMMAGLELNARHLRPQLRAIAAIGG